MNRGFPREPICPSETRSRRKDHQPRETAADFLVGFRQNSRQRGRLPRRCRLGSCLSQLIPPPCSIVIAADIRYYCVYVMRQASRRLRRIGQKRPVNVVFISYRNALQADVPKLVAKKLQSSLAVDGETAGGGAGRLRRQRGRPDDGAGLPDSRRRRGGHSRDDGGGLRGGKGRWRPREELLVDEHWEAGGDRASGGRGQREQPPLYGHDTIGPTVELVLDNGHHANGNGNGHHDEDPELRQSLFSLAEFRAEEPVKPKAAAARLSPLLHHCSSGR